MPILELILRGSLVYLVIFVLLRFVLKRVAGTLNIGDLLVIVLIADASQNAMSAGYTSLTDGLILVATIIFWTYALDWLAITFLDLKACYIRHRYRWCATAKCWRATCGVS